VVRDPELMSELVSVRGARVERDVPMAEHTTWRVGGPAELMAFVSSESALIKILALARQAALAVRVLGNGSDVLVSDGGIGGIVLRLEGDLTGISVSGDILAAGAGAGLGPLVGRASVAGLSGVEFAAGIPGTVGGAVMTNAGALSSCFADRVVEVTTIALDGTARRHVDFAGAYREAMVPVDEVVVGARLKLDRAPRSEVEDRVEDAKSRRRRTQPLGAATAGSVFKNPPGDFAGRLIDLCGLKGKAAGGARISEVHANFIVNDGGATAAEIVSLIELVRAAVRSRFGTELELEVKLIGFEGE
jgi:UDP-N-acetylmuramate dehydrogenase